MTAPRRAVLDTNVVLSALVFRQGRSGGVREAWQQRRFTPLVSKATASELMRALAYPKFRLTAESQNELLADYLPWCMSVRMPQRPPDTPACRDPDDQMFLQFAMVGKADWVVSGYQDLLALARRFDRPILTPGQILAEIGMA